MVVSFHWMFYYMASGVVFHVCWGMTHQYIIAYFHDINISLQMSYYTVLETLCTKIKWEFYIWAFFIYSALHLILALCTCYHNQVAIHLILWLAGESSIAQLEADFIKRMFAIIVCIWKINISIGWSLHRASVFKMYSNFPRIITVIDITSMYRSKHFIAKLWY